MLGADDGIDGDFIERIEQLGKPSLGRRSSLTGFPKPEVFLDIIGMGQAEGRPVGDQRTEAMPGFDIELIFEEMVELLVELDESMIFRLHSGFC